MRRRIGVRRHQEPKPGTCTEQCGVDPSGVSVKVSASKTQPTDAVTERKFQRLETGLRLAIFASLASANRRA